MSASILIVDDKENMLALLGDILSPHYQVTKAGDGASALTLVDDRSFDVVITDVRMPGADGHQVVRAVKARTPTTEVIVMTAFASIPAAVEAIRDGAYDYIQKPFDPDDVSLVVARALQRKRERETAGTQGTVGPEPAKADLASLSYRDAMTAAREQGSREYLVALLRAFGGNVSRAAERAGMERESLHRLLRRYGVKAEAFRGDDPPPDSST
jgi:DNA-binding NtrC family response regulator